MLRVGVLFSIERADARDVVLVVCVGLFLTAVTDRVLCAREKRNVLSEPVCISEICASYCRFDATQSQA